jgi:NAD+ diphosphatase
MNRAGRGEAESHWAKAKVIQIWRGLILAKDGQISYQNSGTYSESDLSSRIYLGEIAGQHYFAMNKEVFEGPTLRDISSTLNETDLEIAVTALALINWHETHRKCSRCGSETEVVENGWVRKCPVDETSHFPRTDPAIIVAVQDRNGRLCLGRQSVWPEKRFSNFAGFVEPGESLEAAVIREVKEETGLEVTDIKYLFSQPWPFPNSIMLSFEAFTDNPEVAKPDGEEIVDLRWFTKEELVAQVANDQLNLPPFTTVSRKMIERWLNG